MEIRVRFQLDNKKYILFIERGIFKIKIYLFKESEKDNFLTKIPIKVSTSTLNEMIEHWLRELKRNLIKKRCKKSSQSCCSHFRYSFRRYKPPDQTV